jgi:hypothetical protein
MSRTRPTCVEMLDLIEDFSSERIARFGARLIDECVRPFCADHEQLTVDAFDEDNNRRTASTSDGEQVLPESLQTLFEELSETQRYSYTLFVLRRKDIVGCACAPTHQLVHTDGSSGNPSTGRLDDRRTSCRRCACRCIGGLLSDQSNSLGLKVSTVYSSAHPRSACLCHSTGWA